MVQVKSSYTKFKSRHLKRWWNTDLEVAVYRKRFIYDLETVELRKIGRNIVRQNKMLKD